MIDNILKSLSHTEIMVIAEQLFNENIDENLIYKQLLNKGNDGMTESDMFDEMNSDEFRGTLPRMVAIELASRLREELLNCRIR